MGYAKEKYYEELYETEEETPDSECTRCGEKYHDEWHFLHGLCGYCTHVWDQWNKNEKD